MSFSNAHARIAARKIARDLMALGHHVIRMDGVLPHQNDPDLARAGLVIVVGDAPQGRFEFCHCPVEIRAAIKQDDFINHYAYSG